MLDATIISSAAPLFARFVCMFSDVLERGLNLTLPSEYFVMRHCAWVGTLAAELLVPMFLTVTLVVYALIAKVDEFNGRNK